MSRLARHALLALLLATSSGCFVFEELDAGVTTPTGGKNAAAKKPTPAPAAPTAPKKDGIVPDVGEWWKKARSVTSGEKNERIVRCTLDGREQFMDVDACRARGGRT